MPRRYAATRNFMTRGELVKRFGYYKDEGFTPGLTKCLNCGLEDYLILAVTDAPASTDAVQMVCDKCGKWSQHSFNPA